MCNNVGVGTKPGYSTGMALWPNGWQQLTYSGPVGQEGTFAFNRFLYGNEPWHGKYVPNVANNAAGRFNLICTCKCCMLCYACHTLSTSRHLSARAGRSCQRKRARRRRCSATTPDTTYAAVERDNQ